MDLLDINESQIKSLSRVGMSLTHFWLLHLLYESEVIVYIPQIRERKLLEDRGMISDKGISQGGRYFYEQIRDTQLETPKSKKKEEKVADNKFETWWNNCYPASANFTYRGMVFKSSRALRSNKQVCKMLYDSAVATGVATEDQIITATKYMVEEAKKESFETGTNRLQYLPGSEVFLRQQRYLSFVEVASEHNDNQPSDNCYA